MRKQWMLLGTVPGSVSANPVSVNSTESIVKTFHYYPTASDPFTSVVTTTGGRITDLQRTRNS
ncbi:MAG: hypothetical protein HY067_14600 [Betaproteobacteria bacterium]|nr:hypothetical protein [Betaproteobacteria bacterium]